MNCPFCGSNKGIVARRSIGLGSAPGEIWDEIYLECVHCGATLREEEVTRAARAEEG